MSISYLGDHGESWNPTVGCTPISESCDNCWARRLHEQRYKANRQHSRERGFTGPGGPAEYRLSGHQEHDALPCPHQYDRPFQRIQLLPDRLSEPLRWRTPRTVAVCFMGDLFHEDVPDEFLFHVFGKIMHAPQHTYLILTKRPQRMKAWLDLFWKTGAQAVYEDKAVQERAGADLSDIPEDYITHYAPAVLARELTLKAFPNVWLGVTAETQARADKRIPLLLKTPAAHRWVSAEPLLERLNLDAFLYKKLGYHPNGPERLDWVVVGGESGPGHRPMELHWVDRIEEQCRYADVPYYGKQRSAARAGQALPDKLGRKETPWDR